MVRHVHAEELRERKRMRNNDIETSPFELLAKANGEGL